MVATHQGTVGVHEGHAFVVEAAVSVGGRNIKPGLNIHRFANRIPLLFEVGGEGGAATSASTGCTRSITFSACGMLMKKACGMLSRGDWRRLCCSIGRWIPAVPLCLCRAARM